MSSSLLNFRKFILLLLSSSILLSCASSVLLIDSPSIGKVNISENFTIEGKFKIKINEDVRYGYFTVLKINDSVSLSIGKNYLLPEAKLFYKLHDYVDLLELNVTLSKSIDLEIDKEKFKVKDFLEVLLSSEPMKLENGLEIVYPKGIRVVDDYKFPRSIRVIYKYTSLEILLKKVIKN